MTVTHFEQVVKLIKLCGSESDFLGHHPDLKIGLKFTLNNTETTALTLTTVSSMVTYDILLGRILQCLDHVQFVSLP